MICFFNGEQVAPGEVAVSAWDYGFTMGVTLSEVLRTFGGKPVLLDRHLNRLARGLEFLEIPADVLPQVQSTIEQIVDKSGCRSREQKITVCITPGMDPTRAPGGTNIHQPTILVYADDLNPESWESDYREGIQLTGVETREVPAVCVPRELKTRSRIHYYLAQLQARRANPGSRALLRDLDGNVGEGTTGSVVMVTQGVLVAPSPDKVLPGVSLSLVEQELAPSLNIPMDRRDISLVELYQADEVLWLSTSPCVLPVASVDGRMIGDPRRRPVFESLLNAWGEFVGCPLATI